MKRRGLGKSLSQMGVEELLGGAATAEAPDVKASELTKLAVKDLQPGKYQPRRNMDNEALQELAHSIRSQGIIQPIVVRLVAEGYEIIAGERRWRAAQLANLHEVPVVIRDISDEAALAMSLIENIQRQDLNVIEEALALQRLIDEFQMTHQEVATSVGKSRASVTNLLRLLKLNQDVRDLVESGHLDMGHARALITLESAQQGDVANTIVARALSVRDAEKLIRKLQQKDEQMPEATVDYSDVLRLQKSLASRLGTSVVIKKNSKGKGKLIINYKNPDQLDEILQRIQ